MPGQLPCANKWSSYVEVVHKIVKQRTKVSQFLRTKLVEVLEGKRITSNDDIAGTLQGMADHRFTSVSFFTNKVSDMNTLVDSL